MVANVTMAERLVIQLQNIIQLQVHAVNITWGLFGKFEQNKTGQHYFYPNTFPKENAVLLKAQIENVPFILNDSMEYEGHHGAILWYHDHA
jgi:hypothetical protein